MTCRRLQDTCTSSLQVTPNWRGGTWCPEGRAALQRALQEQSQRSSARTDRQTDSTFCSGTGEATAGMWVRHCLAREQPGDTGPGKSRAGQGQQCVLRPPAPGWVGSPPLSLLIAPHPAFLGTLLPAPGGEQQQRGLSSAGLGWAGELQHSLHELRLGLGVWGWV